VIKFDRRLFPHYARFIVLLLLVLLVMAAVFLFSEVLLPFALAIFLAYLLAPVIDRLNRLRIRRWPVPRGAAILVVYAVILGLIILSGFYLFPRFYVEVNRMVKTLPTVLKDLESDVIVPLEERLNRILSEILPPPVIDVPETVEEEKTQPGISRKEGPPGINGKERHPMQGLVEDYTYVVRRLDDASFEIVAKRKRPTIPGDSSHTFSFNQQISGAFAQFRTGFVENSIEFINLGRQFIRTVVGSFFTLFLVFMLSGFILVDPSRIHRFFVSMIPLRHQSNFDDWMLGLDRGLSGVVRGQVMICLVNGILTGVGIALLGIPFVVTLSVIASVFSLIPIFGVLISTIPILLIALTVSFSTALLALVWILGIHFLEGNFLNPKILGDSAKIHPVLIVFALVVGEHFAGVMGALLAVPIFSLLQTSFLFLKQRAEALESTGHAGP